MKFSINWPEAQKIGIMKQLFTFVKKEFCHVLRDKKVLFILFGIPIMNIAVRVCLEQWGKRQPDHHCRLCKRHCSQQISAKIGSQPVLRCAENGANTPSKLKMSSKKKFDKSRSRFSRKTLWKICRDRKQRRCSWSWMPPTLTINQISNYLAPSLEIILGTEHYGAYPANHAWKSGCLHNPQLRGALNFVSWRNGHGIAVGFVWWWLPSPLWRDHETGTMACCWYRLCARLWLSSPRPFPTYGFVNRQHLYDPVAECVFARPSHKKAACFAHGESCLFIITCLSPGYSHFHQTSSSAGGYVIS